MLRLWLQLNVLQLFHATFVKKNYCMTNKNDDDFIKILISRLDAPPAITNLLQIIFAVPQKFYDPLLSQQCIHIFKIAWY
jgi:hypothetical protein